MIPRKLESSIKLVLPNDGQRHYPLRCHSGARCGEKRKGLTYSAVTNTDNMYLGTTTSGGIRAWRSMHVEYVVGALVAVTLKLRNTIRILANLPAGESIALMSPQMLPSV